MSPIVVLIPVYNDWEAVSRLLGELTAALVDDGAAEQRFEILIVDDGSTAECPEERLREARGPLRLRLLRLRRNLGHQRAIAIGLAYVNRRMTHGYCIVMDGDGEDNPHDIPLLLEAARAQGARRIIFAERARRSESWWFRFGYHCYRALHYVLTGVPVKVGNYSVVPARALERLVVVSELWNHYAAAVFRSRIPYSTVPSVRRPRLEGRSTMNFVSLVTHGLSAISVFGDTVGVRLLMATLGISALAIGGELLVLFNDPVTLLSSPAAALVSLSDLGLQIMQAVVMVILLVFVILAGRQNPAFLPLRDYEYFVLESREL